MESDQKRVDIITFTAPVNDRTSSRLIDLCHICQEEGSSEIHLFISSMGGRIHAGFTAYNFLNLLTTPIITYNIGTIDCSSLALYLMSDHRYVCERCKFILATFEWTFYRNTMYFPEIIEAYESLDLDRCFLAEIFQEKTDGSIDLTACLRGSTKILDGEAATAAGIATCTSGAKPAVPELAKMWVIHD